MTLPNLIVFGAIKSGTGALHQYLNHHPDIFMSPNKEPRYFVRSEGQYLGSQQTSLPINLEEYAAHFEQSASQSIIGESSSNYLYSPQAAIKINKVLPNVKLIASLRNPVDRALAHYKMLTRSETVDSSILGEKKSMWAKASMYHLHLSHYYQIFSPERIKIVIMEEWQNDPDLFLKSIYQFLDIDDSFELNSNIHYKPAVVAWKSSLSKRLLTKIKPYVPLRFVILANSIRTRNWVSPAANVPSDILEEMADWYSEDIRNLETMLQIDLSIWTNAQLPLAQ